MAIVFKAVIHISLPQPRLLKSRMTPAEGRGRIGRELPDRQHYQSPINTRSRGTKVRAAVAFYANARNVYKEIAVIQQSDDVSIMSK